MSTESRDVYKTEVNGHRHMVTRFDAKNPGTARGGMGTYPSHYLVKIFFGRLIPKRDFDNLPRSLSERVMGSCIQGKRIGIR